METPLNEEQVTPEARKAVWGAAIGYAMDGFDLLILGFMLQAISPALGLTQPQAASMVTTPPPCSSAALSWASSSMVCWADMVR